MIVDGSRPALRRSRLTIRFAWVLLLVPTLAPGCGSSRQEVEPPSDSASEETVAAGMLSVLVRLSDDELSPVEDLTLTHRAEYPPGGMLTLDEPSLEAAGWTIVERAEGPPSRPAPDRIRRTTVWTLRPFLPGEYTVPPIITRLEMPGGAETMTAESNPFTVKVRSLLPEATERDAEVAPEAFGPLRDRPETAGSRDSSPPRSRTLWLVAVAIVAILLLIPALRWFRAVGPRVPPEPSTEDLLRALEGMVPTDGSWLLIAPHLLARALEPEAHAPPGLTAIDLRTIAHRVGRADAAALASDLEVERYRRPESGESRQRLHARTVRLVRTLIPSPTTTESSA